MPTLWITYAWADDIDGDVQFVAEYLAPALDVKIDRWVLNAGRRLWPQIEKFITDPQQSDAWAIYATENSLASQPCQEELAYALDRVLAQRDINFPLIGIFPGNIAKINIPAAIRTRLYVSTTDPDWRERIVAAVERRTPTIYRPSHEPFSWKLNQLPNGWILELRPRIGSWLPTLIAVPINEREAISNVIYGPRNSTNPSVGFVSYLLPPGAEESGNYWCWQLGHEITPTVSCYVFLNTLPSKIIFGSSSGPRYTLETKRTSV